MGGPGSGRKKGSYNKKSKEYYAKIRNSKSGRQGHRMDAALAKKYASDKGSGKLNRVFGIK